MSARGYIRILMLCISLIEVLQWTGGILSSLSAEIKFHTVDREATSKALLLPSRSAMAVSSFTRQSQPLLEEALQQCHAAKEIFGIYPSVIEQLMELRSKHKYNYTSKAWRLVKDKLGGYAFASLLGIQRPHVFFCGEAKDFPFDNWTDAFGPNFVMKPYKGCRSRGVKVVRNGVDMFAGGNMTNKNGTTTTTLEELSNRTHIIEQYGPDAIVIVEALNESPDPAWDNLIPPDYKFLTAGGETNLGYYVDRNLGQSCGSYFAPFNPPHVSNKTGGVDDANEDAEKFVWGPAGKAVPHGSEPCNRSDFGFDSKKRNRNMIEAVEGMAQYFNGNYVRIDMFDTKHGPILGEFEHSVGRGANRELEGCLESYIFLKSAAENPYSDDSKFILQRFIDKQEDFRLDDYLVESVRPLRGLRNPFGFLPSKVNAHHKDITDRILSWFHPSLDSSVSSDDSHAPAIPLLKEVDKLADKFRKIDARRKCKLVLETQQNDWFRSALQGGAQQLAYS